MMKDEIQAHLTEKLIPFWQSMRDDKYGGYYGYMDYGLTVDKRAVKGGILNSRILWFFSNAYLLLKEERLLEEARHGYAFLREHCLDRENGGVYWSVRYDGTPQDTAKHTYNQAFAIYALSSYYAASGDREAFDTAFALYELVEGTCRDEVGYLEAFDRQFCPIDNDKLSENGVMAEKTMNTLLHVFEAYTELYRVSGKREVGRRMRALLDIFGEKVYHPELKRQEVFFDRQMNSILDLHSYGHDIETAWLLDRGVALLGDRAYEQKLSPITTALTEQVYETAFDGHSLANECEKGVVDNRRIWWVQAEALVGFLNGWQKRPDGQKYLEAARAEWEFIKSYVIDARKGSEWFWEVDETGKPYEGRPIVEPWKCPYHNGRMCMEVIKRLSERG